MNVFQDIYRRNAWNGLESRSGPGSGRVPTARVAEEIVRLAAELGVQSVLDIGCGDGFWMPELPGYVGIDVAPAAVTLAKRNHPERFYQFGDVRHLPAQAFDLVIFRDAMQHLPLKDGVIALQKIRATNSRYLLASTYVDGHNRDVEAGGYFRPNLSVEPYAMGDPARVIFDGYDYGIPDRIRDPGKVLGLWALQ